MRKYAPALLAAVAIAAVALAADVRMGVSSDYSQPIGGRTTAGTVGPILVTDAGAVTTAPGSGPDGYRRITASAVKLTCPAAGTTGYKLSTDTCFECSVSGELAWVCEALNCATLGYQVSPGARYKTCFNQSATGGADAGPTSDYSCRSASGTALIDCVPLR